MIRFADELIDAIQANNVSKDMEVRLDGCASISRVVVDGDHIDILGEHSKSSEIEELNDEIRRLDLELSDCRDAMNLVCSNIGDIHYYINEYLRMHPVEAKALSGLELDVLEDFVKTSINWYNIKYRIESEC